MEPMTKAEFQELMGAGFTFSSYADYDTAYQVACRAVERERERCADIADDEDMGNLESIKARVIARRIRGSE